MTQYPCETSTLGVLYTIGYTACGCSLMLDQLTALDVTIVDIRLKAVSTLPRWDALALSRWLGGYYWHLPALGNLDYRHEDPTRVTLAAPVIGIPQLVSRLQRGEALALLCACSEVTRCHRRVVAELVQAEVPGVQVIHLLGEARQGDRR